MSAIIDNVSIHSVEELDGKIPGYKVTDFIAKGGMGAVYLGLQETLEREVAIKILPPELTQDENFKSAFQTEAKAMAKVSHGNLVGIYDFGRVDDFLYIVMEFVKGRTLFNVINGVAVDELEAAELIIAMCQGLEKAHNAGIIHRDIKPANILIDDQGVPKIVDFGLARPAEKTEEGVIFGTPGYTAPEVVKNPQAVDRKSDIFSVGVMLFELLTGEVPAQTGQVPSYLADSHKEFDVIVAKATHPINTMRYQSAAEMAGCLQALLLKLSSNASPAPVSGVRLATSAAPTQAQAGVIGAPALARPTAPTRVSLSRNVTAQKSGISGIQVALIIGLLGAIGAIVFLKQGGDDAGVVVDEKGEPAEAVLLPKKRTANSSSAAEGKARAARKAGVARADRGNKNKKDKKLAEKAAASNDRKAEGVHSRKKETPLIAGSKNKKGGGKKVKKISFPNMDKNHQYTISEVDANRPPVQCQWVKMNELLNSYLASNKEADLNKDGFLGLSEYAENELPYEKRDPSKKDSHDVISVIYRQYIYMAFPEADENGTGRVNVRELKNFERLNQLPSTFQH